MSILTISDIDKAYGETEALSAVNLDVESGEIVCLLGPSGCGKTTLLRIVAGLEIPDSGHVAFDGQNLTEVPVHRRQFGLMFQEFALFPHKTVWANIAFGLQMQGMGREQVVQRVDEVLNLVDLKGYGDRAVDSLSGGERQRVALARSLAPSPKLLMLDEPLGSLDRTLRENLMVELRRILKQIGVTALYVTHDQQEAFAVADRIVVMKSGGIVQIGTPEQVYARPQTAFVARFLGLTNLVPVIRWSNNQVETPIGMFTLDNSDSDRTKAVSTQALLIRPEIERENLGSSASAGQVTGTLEAISFRGSDYHINVSIPEIDTGGDREHYLFDFVLPTRHRGQLQLPKVGESIQLGIDVSQLLLL